MAGLIILPTAATAFQILDEPLDEAADIAPAEIAAVEPEPGGEALIVEEPLEYELWLDISINGHRRNKVVAIYREADGSLSATRADLADIGLLAPGAAGANEARVPLAALEGVTYVFDEIEQTIDFTAPEGARARLIVKADGRSDDPADAVEEPGSSFGVLVNYDIYASASMTNGGVLSASMPSASFEAKAYGPFGLLEQTFSLETDPLKLQRLNTTWSYSDPAAMRTYRAGDIVTGALGWTRPTRLGGIQVQNDFGLRSDMITYPVPSFSGTAALPSAVEVYVNKSSRYEGEVPEGPFEIVDVPVLTGAGTVELVVTDAAGNETVTTADYFASPRLLKPGLVDYSAEIGFARTYFGGEGDGYDRRLMGSGSIRAGVTDWLTWEGHAEGGLDLINAGTGVVATLGQLGLGQFAVAGSKTADALGVQLTSSLQLSFGNVAVGARAQKSFGRFEDIASFTAPGIVDRSAATDSSLYQLSLSLPTPFEGARANLSYTQLAPASGDAVQLVAASYSQRLFAGSSSASAYADLNSGRYGASINLWMPLGADISGRASMRQTGDGAVYSSSIGNAAGNEVGDVGWLASVEHGDKTSYSAAVRTKLPAASLRARLQHRDARTSASGTMSGAIVAADGGLFAANRIGDAFAVVDAGAPDVPVYFQNRKIGVTGSNGRLLVPGLTAYEKNRISIDPTFLPLGKMVDNSTAIAVPARGAGVLVSFGKRSSGGTALVSFRDAAGEFLPLASSVTIGDSGAEFIVGYDGEALLDGLGPDNIATIALPDGSSCVAEIPFTDQGGDFVSIADIVCL